MSSIDKIRELVSKHRLHFTYNSGGGEFWMDGDDMSQHCQISTLDDDKDYKTLSNWLKDRGRK